MSQSLRVLIIEDSQDDAELLIHALRRGGYDVSSRVIETPEEMKLALEGAEWDLITSDHAMPCFSAPEALALANELSPAVPFLIVSGEMDLSLAVSLMRGGAMDYIQKRDLALVVPAVERVLREVGLRRDRERDQATLLANESWRRAIMQTAMDGFFMLDLDGCILEVNEAYCRMSGYSAAEILAMHLSDLELNEGRDEISAHIQQVLTRGPDRFETRHRRKDGNQVDLEVSVQHRPEMGGRLIVFVRDITERKRGEQQLHESESRYRAIFDHSPYGILFTSPDGRIYGANAAACRILGRAEDEICQIGRDRLVDLTDPRLPIAIEERNRLGKFSGELTFIRSGGEKFPVEVSSEVFTHTDGKARTAVIFRDVSGRKRRIEELRAGEERLRLILDTLSEGVSLNEYVFDEQGEAVDYRVLEVNAAFYQVADFRREGDVLGRLASDLYGMSAEVVREFYRGHKDAGQTIHTELVSPLSKRTFFIATSPLRENRFVTSFIDMTDYKQAEAALVESEARYRAIFDASPLGILFSAPDGRIFAANPAACRMLGRSEEEIRRVGREGVADKIDPEVARAIRERQQDGVFVGEVTHIRANGERFPAEVSTSIFQDRDGNDRALVIFRDITERKRVEEELRASEARFRAVVENSYDGILFCDANAVIQYRSPSYKKINGYEDDERLGHSGFETVHPDDISQVRAYWGKLVANPGSSERHEFRTRHRDGSWRWIESFGQNLLANPDVKSIVITSRDITERKQAEEQILRLNAELEQRVTERTTQLSAMNQELEAFAYSVSHDLRAPVRGLQGFSALLQQEYAARLDEKGNHYLVRIQEAALRMGELISDLLDLSRLTRAEFHPGAVDLSLHAREITADLQAQSPRRQVKVEIEPNLVATGDEKLLKIVLENLLENAYKFTGQRDLAVIQVGSEEQDGKRVFFVRDNGAGFNMQYAGKLFAPFRRLHNEVDFPGTGIGLATVQRIIHRHDGQVWARGEVDKGATFYFTLG